MLFELETALRFLRPQKSQLARTLIALSALGVVSVVSWLVLVFYSVTEGLEKRWIDQMVQVSGSLRVTPTYAYFDHSDFVIDSYRASSAYQPTLLTEKIKSPQIDPSDLSNPLPSYLNEAADPSWIRPSYFVWKLLENDNPVVTLCAPVQIEILQFREKGQNLENSDFPSTGLFRLQQNGYLTCYYPSSQSLESLTQSPEAGDWNDLFLSLSQPHLQYPWPELENWMSQASELELVWKSSKSPLWTDESLANNSFSSIWIETERWILQKASAPQWNSQLGRWLHLVQLTQDSSTSIKAYIPAGFLKVKKVAVKAWEITNPKESQEGRIAILAPKILKDMGLTLGSMLHLSKELPGPLGIQNYERDALVVGFYDSGIIPLGGRFLIASYDEVAPWIEPLEQDPKAQFFQAWPKNPLEEAKKIREALKKQNLDSLFTVQSYEDFEASYDLLMQLRSDRLLLSLIAFIILIVASSSICTMMMLLVNERRKEIAVLKTLGMSSKRLCACFALSGLILGILGAFIGTTLALITLQNLDGLIYALSYFQGSPLLNPLYYGKTLPNTLSLHALKMIIGGNITLALLGSTLAAWQTSRLNPTTLFRSLQ